LTARFQTTGIHDYLSLQRAFNLEIASIPEAVNLNNETGLMRYKWWKDVIGELYKVSSLA
jgi:hypothetical protein